MFEDATFETMGKIHTHSRDWMLATLFFNGTIVLAMILIPLFHPEALPKLWIPSLLETPRPPATQDAPKPQTTQVAVGTPEMPMGIIIAPRRIPEGILKPNAPEPAIVGPIGNLWNDTGIQYGAPNGMSTPAAKPIVRPAVSAPVRVSSGVVASLLVHKTVPVYPPIAIAARVEGTVILQATISKTGTIENLRVAGGPAMLQQAALDAVRNWRYRPYLLNNEPVEVDTTVNVVFMLNH